MTTPPGFKEAWDQFVAERLDDAFARRRNMAGRGCRTVVSTAVAEYLCSANHSFEMYNGLTQGAIAALLVKGSDEQKANYLPNMVGGRWTGTMNLTEPHCGTDLGLLKTRADPNPRRQLFADRHQDLHLVGRARPQPRTSSTWCSPRSPARRTM